MILLHFTMIYTLGYYVYCNCMGEVLCNGGLLCIFSQPSVLRCHVGSMKLVIVGILTPWQLEGATN